MIASEASNLCLRVEPGDQIDANSFSHFLGGKAVERTPPCVLHNSVHLARIALRQLVYIAVHILNIYMPKKIRETGGMASQIEATS